MKREKSIKEIKKSFDKFIKTIEDSNGTHFETSISSKENGIKFLKIEVELE